MTDFFRGGEDIDFEAINGAVVVTTGFEAGVSRCSLQAHNTSQWRGHFWQPSLEFWWHAVLRPGAVPQTDMLTPIAVFSDGTTDLLRLMGRGVAGMRLEAWDGATWLAASNDWAWDAASIQRLDIRVKIAASGGELAFYANEVAVGGGLTGDTDFIGTAGITRFTLSALTFGSGLGSRLAQWSQIRARTRSTLGYKLHTLAPATNGTHTAWAGTVTEVDEVVLNQGDLISSTSGDKESFGMTDLAAAVSGMAVSGVAIHVQARCGSTGPQALRGLAVIGGTDYTTADQALGLAYETKRFELPTDPSTGATWTQAAVSGAELGVESRP